MARIVSGREELADPGFAFLAGQQGAREFGLEQNQQQLRQIALMTEIQKAAHDWQIEKAKSQALLNKQAEMGQVKAMQQLAMEQQLDANPEAAQFREFLGIRKGISDEDALSAFDKTYSDLVESQKKEKGYQEAERQVQGLAQDPIFAGNEQKIQDWAGRLQVKRAAGESVDDVLTEVASTKKELIAQQQLQEKWAMAIERAKQLVLGAADGPAKTQADEMVKAAESFSTTRQDVDPAQLIEDVVKLTSPVRRGKDPVLAEKEKQAAATRGDWVQRMAKGEGLTGEDKAAFIEEGPKMPGTDATLSEFKKNLESDKPKDLVGPGGMKEAAKKKRGTREARMPGSTSNGKVQAPAVSPESTVGKQGPLTPGDDRSKRVRALVWDIMPSVTTGAELRERIEKDLGEDPYDERTLAIIEQTMKEWREAVGSRSR